MNFETAENKNQKGSKLEGGAISDEVLASSESVHDKGLQQFYTPPEAAGLIMKVVGSRVCALDLTAGDGSLLQAFDRQYRYGVEIDPDQIENATEADRGYNSIKGDVQHVYTLLRNAGPEWPAIVINPPFGLRWQDPCYKDNRQVNSTVLTFVYASRLLANNGQLVLISGLNRFYREIAPLDEAKDLFYAVIECEDLFPGTREPAVIAFGMHPDLRATGELPEAFATRKLSRDMIDLAGTWVIEQREKHKTSYSDVADRSWYSDHTDLFSAIQKEYDRRTGERVKKDREWDAMLGDAGKIQFLPSSYAVEALKKLGGYDEIRYLHGQSLNYFVQAEKLWLKMQSYKEAGCITIQPEFEKKVDEIVGDIRKELVPLYDIKPQQALGFLLDTETLKCIRDAPEDRFVKGEHYRVTCRTKTIIDNESRVVESKKNPGEYTTKQFKIQKKVMEIRLFGQTANKTILDGGGEASENIKWLVDHFEIPNPGSVATAHPNEINAIEEKVQVILDEFAANSLKYEAKHKSLTPYSHRPFQKRDISRLLFKGSGLLSWEQGLGKTLGGLMFARGTQVVHNAQDATLIVTAKDLIPQWSREIERFMGVKPTLIKTHAHAKEVSKHLRMGGTGIYITYYEALSIVGTRNKNALLPTVTVREWQERRLVAGTDRYGQFYFDDDEEGTSTLKATPGEDGEHEYRVQIPLTKARPTAPEGRTARYGYVRPTYENVTKKLTSRELCPQCEADLRNGWNGIYCESKNDKGEKCGYTHYAVRLKPIASFLSTAFAKGTIILDEITLIQGQYSKRSIALRGLRAKHKLGMTGTPIKNFIGQAFWLLWWCLGNGTRRFPYEYDGGYITFENDFSVVEWQIDGGRKSSRKALPEVTNLSKLWRLLSSSIIRRRKEETGENLVPIFYHEIRCPMGMAQAEQTNAWLKNFPAFFAEKYPEAPIVKAGMHKIMAPMLGLNWKLDYTCTVPAKDPDFEWTGVYGVSNFTPANLRVIELAMSLAKEGRKVLIGSNLVSTSEWIAEQLIGKGVKAEHILDGDGTTVNPEERAKRVYSFQTSDVQVFAAGVNAIRLGHNLDAADAVIMHGLDWSFDTMDQFIARVHRLTSKNPIDVFVVLPALEKQETITTRKWGMLGMKADAIDFALDGRLVAKREQTITEAEVIRELMERGMIATDECVDEVSVELAWNEVKQLDEYEVIEGMIPARPEIETEAEASEKSKMEACEVIGKILSLYWENPEMSEKPITPEEAVEAETDYDDLTFEEDEDEIVANDTISNDLGSVSTDEPDEMETATAVSQEPATDTCDDIPEDGLGGTQSVQGEIAQQAAQVEEANGEEAPITTENPPASLDVMGQIKQAAELHALGILTDDEFTQAKADLLILLRGGGSL